jgi:hypothetical protein
MTRKKNNKRLSNRLESATEKTKKEYLESLCDEIMELKRRGPYDLLYMKTKKVVGKTTVGIKESASKLSMKDQ